MAVVCACFVRCGGGVEILVYVVEVQLARIGSQACGGVVASLWGTIVGVVCILSFI